MIFDTHAHYDDKAFDGDREELLNNMKKDGVEFIVNVGSDLASIKKTLALAEKFPFIYAAIGVHPSETGELTEEGISWLHKQSENPRVVAIGEIGLDYYWPEPGRDIQKKWFERQLSLADKTGLPIIVHSRDAAKDTLEILKGWQQRKTAGVIHCYSYTKELAREYLNMDYYFGIGGVITFKNARKLVEAVEYIPMDRILLETDCPYLAPEPYRGKRNQSSYINYAAQKVAEIKNLSKEEVLAQTMRNAKDFYRISGV